MFSRLSKSLLGITSNSQIRSRRRRSHRAFPIATQALEDRILLAADIRTWDGGGSTPDFATPENWVNDIAPDSDDIANFVTTGQQAHVFEMGASLLLALLLIFTLSNAASAARKPAAAQKPATLVTYRFTARITDNAGVTPFKVGTRITGEFT